MRAPQTIIKRPLLTEKSARLRETGGGASAKAEGDSYAQQAVFEVARDANKVEIARAVEKLFNVHVREVRTMQYRGKERRVGRTIGRRASWKKAVVTLREGETIEIFQGV